MAFVPKSGDHAIVEVVFGLTMSRAFFAHEIEAVVKAHERWKEQLPRLSRTNMLQIAIGDTPPPPNIPMPVGGVTFDRINADGTLAWRLRFENESIFVNCLSYERWEVTWPQVLSYLYQACEVAIGEDDNSVHGCLFQVVDMFVWADDPAAYDLAHLLDAQSQYLPASIWGKGPFWHLHQGWFRTNDLPVGATRLLERMKMDAARDAQGALTLKLDVFHNLTLGDPKHPNDFFGEQGYGENLFNHLHDQNKDIVRDLITKEMADRIGLDG